MGHAGAPPAPPLRVVVAYSPRPRVVDLTALALPAGATVRDALAASGLRERHPGLDFEAQVVGVWGQRQALDAPLREGDRVEVYRPLQVDPKEARRQRYRRQKERGAGRPGRSRATCTPTRSRRACAGSLPRAACRRAPRARPSR